MRGEVSEGENKEEFVLVSLFLPTNCRLFPYATFLSYGRHEYLLTCMIDEIREMGEEAEDTGDSSIALGEP